MDAAGPAGHDDVFDCRCGGDPRREDARAVRACRAGVGSSEHGVDPGSAQVQWVGNVTSASSLGDQRRGDVECEGDVCPASPVGLDGWRCVGGRWSVAGDVAFHGGWEHSSADRIVGPAVSVVNRGVVTSLTSTATQMRKLELEVSGALSVDATSRIDVSGKGYLPGRTTGNTTVGGATGNSGGSYGGLGGTTTARRTRCTGTTRIRTTGAAAPVPVMAVSGAGWCGLRGGPCSWTGKFWPTVWAGGSGGGVYVAVTSLAGAGGLRHRGPAAVGVPAAVVDGSRCMRRTFGTFTVGSIVALGGTSTPVTMSPGGAGTVWPVTGRPHTHVRSYDPVGLNGGHIRSIDHAIVEFNCPINTNQDIASRVEIRSLSDFCVSRAGYVICW